MKYSDLTNSAHKGAYRNGQKAQQAGEPRTAPYKAGFYSAQHFTRAWLAGYDAEAKKVK